MKKTTISLTTIILLLSCSKYNVKTLVEQSSNISNYKKSGIVFRISKNCVFTLDEIIMNTKSWTEGYKKYNDIQFIPGISNNASIYNTDADRFYQLSINNSFLKFKSIGTIKLYLQNNKSELKKILSKNNLDSLIIYEINSGFSGELQIFDFESVIVVVDSNLNMIYLDYQKDGFEGDGIYPASLRKHLLNKISERFIEKMFEFSYIDKSE